MYRSDILEITAWPNSDPSTAPLPPRSALVCVIDISVDAIFDGVETLFFTRRGDTDELWSGIGEELPAHGVGCVGGPATSNLPSDLSVYGRVMTRRAVGDGLRTIVFSDPFSDAHRPYHFCNTLIRARAYPPASGRSCGHLKAFGFFCVPGSGRRTTTHIHNVTRVTRTSSWRWHSSASAWR